LKSLARWQGILLDFSISTRSGRELTLRRSFLKFQNFSEERGERDV
jgi:hypothetical protein